MGGPTGYLCSPYGCLRRQQSFNFERGTPAMGTKFAPTSDGIRAD